MKTVINKITGEKLYNTNVYDIFLNENEELVDFIPETTTLTPEQEAEIAVALEFEMYIKRKTDGENAYLKLSAEFRLLKLSGQLSEETHNFIEATLTPVRNEVMFGQWKKGLELLEKLGSTLIGQTLYDRLHIQITEYISANY